MESHERVTMSIAKHHRTKGEGAFFQRKDGTWVGRIDLPPTPRNPRPRKEVSSKNKAVAQRKFRELKKQLDKLGDLPTKSMRVHEWMEYYLDEIAPEHDRPGWLRDKRTYSREWIVPMLGKKRLDQLTARDVRRLRKAVLSSPNNKKIREKPESEWPDDVQMLSVSYANNVHTTLSAALEAAVEEHQISRNVCHLVAKPAPAAAKDNSLTIDQIRVVWNHLDGHEHGPLFYTYLLSGARRGEIAGLEVERYDGATLDASWQLQGIKKGTELSEDFEHRHIVGSRYLTRPKTDESVRVIPVIRPLQIILDEHIGGRTEGFIFVNDQGEPFYPSTITKMWKAVMDELGIKGVTLHGTRHALIDLLNDAGASPGIIQDIFGHTSREMSDSYRTRANLPGAKLALESAWDLLGIEG